MSKVIMLHMDANEHSEYAKRTSPDKYIVILNNAEDIRITNEYDASTGKKYVSIEITYVSGRVRKIAMGTEQWNTLYWRLRNNDY